MYAPRSLPPTFSADRGVEELTRRSTSSPPFSFSPPKRQLCVTTPTRLFPRFPCFWLTVWTHWSRSRQQGQGPACRKGQGGGRNQVKDPLRPECSTRFALPHARHSPVLNVYSIPRNIFQRVESSRFGRGPPGLRGEERGTPRVSETPAVFLSARRGLCLELPAVLVTLGCLS